MSRNLLMSLARFTKECPGLAGSITRLYGDEVAFQVAADYCVVADRGGNVELGLSREQGVSFNPRIARIVSLVIQDCGKVEPSMVRVAVYSSLPRESGCDIPVDVAGDVAAVKDPSLESSSWIQGISLAVMLDRVRHLHMITCTLGEKEAYLNEVRSSPLIASQSGAPETLRLKLLHAIDMQTRRISFDRTT